MGPVLLPPEEQKRIILDAEEKLASFSKKVDVFEEAVAGLEEKIDELSSLQARLEQLAREMGECREALRGLEESQSRKGADAAEVLGRLDALSRGLSGLSVKADTLLSMLGQMGGEIHRDVEAVSSLAHLSEDLKALRGEAQEVGKNIGENIREISTSLGHLRERGERQHQEVSTFLSRVEGHIDSLRERVDAIPDTGTFSEQIQRLADREDAILSATNPLPGELAALRGEMRELSGKVAGLDSRLSLVREVAAQQGEISARISRLEDRLAKGLGETARLSEMVQNLAYVVIVLFVIGTLSAFFFAIFL
ncbi:MAG: hypothetical protein QFX32_05925 [Methanolinea sp.]|nr:hypothetical protein [Methanolinea sp.]